LRAKANSQGTMDQDFKSLSPTDIIIKEVPANHKQSSFKTLWQFKVQRETPILCKPFDYFSGNPNANAS